MNRIFSILFLFFQVSTAIAQNPTIASDSKIQDFGVLENINNIRSEFVIKNIGTKNLYVLRADAKYGIKVRINNKTIVPGDTSTLYVYMEPKTVGKFNEEIKLITSADALPFILSIKGNIKSIKYDDKTACFYFNTSKVKNTSAPVVIEMPDFKYLDRKDTLKHDSIIQEVSKPELVILEPPKPIEDPIKPLDKRIYKSNNITFLIDVSASMRDSLKLPLMKEAMHSLILELRDIDNVNIITYSEEANIIKQGVSGNKKEILNECIKDLHAKGKTMGAQAILFSLDVALKYYLHDGNNQLFLITDGIFKFTDQHYEKWKQKVGEHKMVFSIIGLGNNEKAIAQLQEMATKRQGGFIFLKNQQDAKTVILEEIKAHAKK